MINILEILKKIPNLEDMVFYSPLYGDVKIKLFLNTAYYPIFVEAMSKKSSTYLTKYGIYSDSDEGELMLYPSRQQRNWSEFKILRKDLPEGTRVAVFDGAPTEGGVRIRTYNGKGCCLKADYATSTDIPWKYIIPVDKFNFNDWSFKEEDNYGTSHKE